MGITHHDYLTLKYWEVFLQKGNVREKNGATHENQHGSLKKKSFKNYSEAWEKGKQLQSTIGKSSSETGAFPKRNRLDVNYTNKWILA